MTIAAQNGFCLQLVMMILSGACVYTQLRDGGVVMSHRGSIVHPRVLIFSASFR